MNRVKLLNHQGKSIVLIDLSQAKVEEILVTLKEATSVIAQQGPKKARVLTDVNNAAYTRQVSDAIKSFTTGNTPYVYSSAVTGLDSIRSVLLQTVNILTRRDIKVFSDQRSALDFLALDK